SLDEGLPYYTLSYVWGENRKDCSILVNGTRLLVTKSLLAALKRMRAIKERDSIFVWVDAICINQREDKERNHQVGLMGKIYSSCKEVLFWMGEHESSALATMEHLCNNSWFRRIWVVQESVLAPSATVLVGPISLPLKVLVAAGDNLRSHTTKGCCATSTSSAYMDRGTIRTFLDNIDEILFFKNEIKFDSNEMSLFRICLDLSQREATEDIDRVYGCLGLVTKWLGHERMRSDYNLPSWAIDFTTFGRAGPIDYSSWLSQVDTYDASRNWTSKAIVRDNKILAVSGIEFDSILVQGDVMNFHDVATRMQTFREWKNLMGHPDQPYPGGGTRRDAWWYALCGGCCWGANSIRRINTDDLSFFSAIATEKHMEIAPSSFFAKTDTNATPSVFFKDGIPSLNHFADIMNMVISTVHGRRLFMTRNGYLGLGREDILVGDKLFILAGGQIPFLLRQSRNEFVPEEESHSSRLVYRLVGELFVHGVMDGEIIESHKGSDSTVFIE
ncbi:heterokaryon incompatibility protein-domain-containing protein, partial [Rhexocercosporidium sp. MPI-PUGE-AT-0058]